MENYPSDWISLKEFVNFLVFDQFVSENDVMSITQTATELGYFEVKDGMIISVKAKENREKAKREREERLKLLEKREMLPAKTELEQEIQKELEDAFQHGSS